MLGESQQNLHTLASVANETITPALTHYKLGQSLAKQGRWEEAIAQYQKALELDPSLDVAHQELQVALAKTKITPADPQKMLPSKGLSSDSHSDEVADYWAKAQAFAKKGQLEAVINQLQEVIKRQPSYEAYRELSRTQSRLKQPAESAESLYQALSLNPEKATAQQHFQLGNTFAKQDDWEKAVTCYRRAVNQDFNFFPAYRNLASILARQRDWPSAIAAYREAIAINPDSAVIHKELAVALTQEQQWTEAIKAYRQAMLQQPKDSWVNEQLFRLLEKQEDWLQLETVCREGIQREPKESKFYHFLGKALSQLERWEDAIAAYRNAIALESGFFWSHQNLGEAFSQLERWEDAIAAYRNAIAINDTWAWSHYHLGEALLQLCRWQEAARTYRKAKSLDPNLPKINQKIGEALRQKQQITQQTPHPQHLDKYYQALQANSDEALFQETSIPNPPPSDHSNLSTPSQTVQKETTSSEKPPMVESPTETDDRQLTDKEETSVISNWLAYFQSTDQLVNKGQLEAAIERYSELIANNPEETEVYQKVIERLAKIFNLSHNLTSFNRLYSLLWEHPNTSKLTLEYGRWLTSTIIYLEGSIEDSWVLGTAKLILSFPENYQLAPAYFFQISDHRFAAIAVLKETQNKITKQPCQISVLHGSRLVTIERHLVGEARGLELIQYLNQKPEHPRERIREQISKTIINLIRYSKEKKGAREFLRKLQKFIQFPTVNLVSPNSPFSIFIDRAIPTQNRGVFISGWMYDASAMLQEIDMISDLGFSQKLQIQDIYKYTRSDVNQFLNENGCSVSPREKLGFCAYVSIPDEIHQAFSPIADLYGFRFIITLEGDVEYKIRPEIKQYDPHLARSTILELIDGAQVSDEMLDNCLGKASYYLQQVCAKKGTIHETLVFGKPNEHPLVSIIIPLYKCLDFIKLQFATMAHDRALDQCEIIYVLDSPEQTQEAIAILSEYSALYNLPAHLVIVNQNSGYACANNMGASQARGSYLVLMNSDVVPKTKEWALDMALFYDSLPNIGALAPKLVYEDNAIQHAGMYFEKTTFPFWLNLHYYKGFPSSYKPAQVSRAVPAVTGACLMISRDLYQRVGGLTTDYVIGDFEDSDLCLKCAALGYESWYFADATLYHFERQSVPLNNNYTAGLAWRYNGRLHTRRWGDMIEKLTAKYQSY